MVGFVCAKNIYEFIPAFWDSFLFAELFGNHAENNPADRYS